MKKIKAIAITLLLFVSSMAISQTPPEKDSNEKLKTTAEKKNGERKSQPNKQTQASLKKTGFSAPALTDENDPYQGRKIEFERLFINNKLPSDFPIYHTSYGIRGYNQMIDSYCSHHLDLLTPQVRQKITGNQ